jgi:DNA invertase Pin-like site-specific DNA recombinase
MFTAVIYCRKSTHKKDMNFENSVAYQKSIIHKYAELNYLQIIKEYDDVGFSGKNTDRPGLQEMLMDIKTNKISPDIVLFYSVHRLGRKTNNNINILLELQKYGKKTIFVKDNLFDQDDDNFKQLFLIYSAFAQKTRETILATCDDGRRNKIINDKNFHGGYNPLGYVKDKKTKRLVPAIVENTSDFKEIEGFLIVQFIFYSFLLGESLNGIAKQLNELFGNTRKGVKWSFGTVRDILKNKAYIGIIEGTLKKTEKYFIENANIDPIVDPLLFNFIQHTLDNKGRGRKRNILGRKVEFTVCKNCGNIPVIKGKEMHCLICNISIDLAHLQNRISEYTLQTFTNHIDDNDIEKIKFDLTIRYEMKKNKINSIIQNLDDKKQTIEAGDWGKITKKKLLEANTHALVTKENELFIVQNMVKFLKSASIEQLKDVIIRELPKNLFKLPYIVIIDMTNGDINFLFHQEQEIEVSYG